MDDAQLEGLFRRVWDQLGVAAAGRHHGWHLPTLCTVGRDGAPQARTVVLRRADPARRVIACHTDTRSPKVREIEADPRVAWVFYDAERKEQLRATGRATVLRAGPDADAAWARTPASSRRCYLAPAAPSTPCASASPNLPESVRDRVPGLEETESGRAVFAVIETEIERLDWLSLHHNGHERAAFGRDSAGAWSGAWLEP